MSNGDSVKKQMLDSYNKAIDSELAAFPKAKRLADLIRANRTVQHWQEQANVLAVKRLSFNDHGQVHSAIVTANALKILSIVEARGVKPSVVADNGQIFGPDEARAVVFAAAYLHDIGNMVHREKHEFFSVMLARPVLEDALRQVYPDDPRSQAYLLGEMLHAILSHDEEIQAVTVEACCVKVADGTDCTEGRSRVAYRLGDYGIHSMSARSITDVRLLPGTAEKPLRIEISMRDSTGIFQIEEVLMRKIKTSGFTGKVEIVASVESEKGREMLF